LKLQLKVPVYILAILLVIGIISSGIMIISLRKSTSRQFVEMSETVTEAVKGCLELCMVGGDEHHIQSEINKIALQDQINEISLARTTGLITMSSTPSLINDNLDPYFVQTILRKEYPAIFSSSGDEYSIIAITPVMNSEQCTSCHGQSNRMLGLISVDLNTTSMNQHLKEETILIASLGGLVFVVLGISLGALLRKTVLNPLSLLSASTEKLTHGDYSTRVQIVRNDEIGTLADSINEMAESVQKRNHELEESHMEISELNTSLEKRISERTRDLTSLNRVLNIAYKSSERDSLISDSLFVLLTENELDTGMVHMKNVAAGPITCVSQLDSSEANDISNDQEKISRVCEEVFSSGEMRIINNFKSGESSSGQEGNKESGKSMICLPLKSDRQILGTISFIGRTSVVSRKQLVPVLTAASEALSVALEKIHVTRLADEANRIREQLLEKLIYAQEDERRRISRELHDSTSQSLAALAFKLENLSDDLPENSGDTQERLADIKVQIVETMEDIRELALEIRPAVLDDLGLARAIRFYANEYLGKRGIKIGFDFKDFDGKISASAETMVFRIAQEAMYNIVKHAQASQVDISLNVDDTSAEMIIKDNGKGFDVESVFHSKQLSGSLGLYNMQERTVLLGGDFEIKSFIGKGTSVIIQIPLIGVSNNGK